ncbi:MAG: hypothetical protein G01um101419_534 [Parcubacteria group bacterium Gr01-1014_19]|nr:MAG: hypothetical protein G01um101419_534 [Parcubacteria group bacterium Gr01-1014_19]
MRKFALLFCVVALSSGFGGCINAQRINPEQKWNLQDPYKTTVVETWSDYKTPGNEDSQFYVVVFEHMGRRAEVHVEKSTFDAVHEGSEVDLDLLSVTTTEDDLYFLEVCYTWDIGKHEYNVVFRCDAK